MHSLKSSLALITMTLLLTACGASVSDVDDMGSSDSSVSSVSSVSSAESSLTFVGGSTIIDHDGGFSDFTVEMTGSDDPAMATWNVSVNMDSVYTDTDRLTTHLHAEEFFDIENYPTATFTSTKVLADGADTYNVTGDLTIKGITKSVTFKATVEDNVITVNFDLPRKDFAIGKDSYGEKLLDEHVPVTAVVVLE